MAATFQIPRAYVDALTSYDTAPAMSVESQVPAVDETDVPADTSVAFNICALDGATVLLNSDRIYIGGVIAYDAGSFQNGFTGYCINYVGGTAHKFYIVPPADFTSQQEVAVRVIAQTTIFGSIDETYSFTVEDLTPPTVAGATAVDVARIHVQFDEAVDEETATDPANYTFTGIDVPTAATVPVSVALVAEDTVEVVTDVELSFGKRYRVAVEDVRDAWGNLIAAPGNTAEFVAVTPQTSARRRFDLTRMLPAMNFAEDSTGELARFVAVLQDAVDLTLYEIDRFPRAINSDTAPDAFLDAILTELGNPFVADALAGVLATENAKRRLARVLVDIYRLKGTAKGIIDVVRYLLGIEVTIEQYVLEGWCLGEATLGDDTVLGPSAAFTIYSFQVVAVGPLTDAQRGVITAVVEIMRPAHTHFLGIRET